jgi:hypothetical protein
VTDREHRDGDVGHDDPQQDLARTHRVSSLRVAMLPVRPPTGLIVAVLRPA